MIETDKSTAKGTKVVLVVEDEPSLRFVISEFLRQEGGLAVVEADSGDDARAYLQNNPNCDLVFTDVRMPGAIDGRELALWILEHRPETKVIMASGNLKAEERLAKVTFFPKPYDLDEVLAKVQGLIGEDRADNDVRQASEDG